MAPSSLAILALLLVGFTLVVLGLQIARGDDEEEDDVEEDAEVTDVPRPKPLEMSPGEAPSTAIPVKDEEGLRHALTVIRCGCGTTGPTVEPRWSEMSFAGRRLTSARWTCPTCETERTVYFEVRSSERLVG